MTQSMTTRFTAALAEWEKYNNLETLAGLFSEEAEVGNVIAPRKFHGREGVCDFWKKYRDTFQSLESSFTSTIEQEGRAALEWRTEARGLDGKSISYEGVSILEIKNDRITSFRAYFDSGALGRQMLASEVKADN